MLNLEMIGNKITTLRKNNNMTQNELADRLFVTHQAVSKWENGKSIPSVEILYEITKLFDVSIDFLLDDTEINEHDYESRFKHQSREIVISSFLKSKTPNDDFPHFFYLLNNEERSLILSLLITRSLPLKIDIIWPYLHDKERKFILGAILTDKIDYNIQLLSKHLKLDEIRMIENHLGYRINNYHIHNKNSKVIIK